VGEMKNAYTILVGEAEGKIPHGRAKCIWKNNTKMNLKATGLKKTEQIRLAKDRDHCRALVDMLMNIRFP
jgi:hypothetical protein